MPTEASSKKVQERHELWLVPYGPLNSLPQQLVLQFLPSASPTATSTQPQQQSPLSQSQSCRRAISDPATAIGPLNEVFVFDYRFLFLRSAMLKPTKKMAHVDIIKKEQVAKKIMNQQRRKKTLRVVLAAWFVNTERQSASMAHHGADTRSNDATPFENWFFES